MTRSPGEQENRREGCGGRGEAQGLNVSKISELGTEPSLCPHLPVAEPVYLFHRRVLVLWKKFGHRETEREWIRTGGGRGGDELGGVDVGNSNQDLL